MMENRRLRLFRSRASRAPRTLQFSSRPNANIRARHNQSVGKYVAMNGKKIIIFLKTQPFMFFNIVLWLWYFFNDSIYTRWIRKFFSNRKVCILFEYLTERTCWWQFDWLICLYWRKHSLYSYTYFIRFALNIWSPFTPLNLIKNIFQFQTNQILI